MRSRCWVALRRFFDVMTVLVSTGAPGEFTSMLVKAQAPASRPLTSLYGVKPLQHTAEAACKLCMSCKCLLIVREVSRSGT